jgi:predicted amidophosphoribosyltransferase
MTSFLNWLLPQNCFLCEADCNQPICPNCLSCLPFRDSTFFPVEEVTAKDISQFISSFQAIFSYTYPVDVLIQTAKCYSHKKDSDNKKHPRYHCSLSSLTILSVLGQLMAESLVIEPPLPDVLIPVPLHSIRLRKRGYNQSL